LVTHPERNLVSTGVDSTGSALVMSLLVIFCSVFSVLLLASDDFSIVDGVSAEGLTENGGSCTSGIDDSGGIRAITAGTSFDRFAGHLVGTCDRGRFCAILV